MREGQYLSLNSLTVYSLARKYGIYAYNIYSLLSWQEKKILGDQFIRSIDSVGANIAEGYGRYHYLDRNRFYYNARGSLLESHHWAAILFERHLISDREYGLLGDYYENIHRLLNGLIRSQYPRKST